jgi:tRNA pseudouridine13 synthase
MSLKEKTRKQAISEVWGDWEAVLGHCESETEKRIVMILQGGGNKKNLLAALNAIPHDEMSLHFAAYQSAVWNEVLRRLIVSTGSRCQRLKGG